LPPSRPLQDVPDTAPHHVDIVAYAFDEKSIAAFVAPDSFAIVNITGSASVREALVLGGVAASRPRAVEACMLGIGSVGMMSVEGPAPIRRQQI
jgi:hypothetical protein